LQLRVFLEAPAKGIANIQGFDSPGTVVTPANRLRRT
jgi:hypothetical protein